MFRIKYTEISGNPPKLNREFVGRPPEEFSDMFDRFSELYAIRAFNADDELHKRPLKPKNERNCRFCKTTYGKHEKFKSLAHLLPHLMGNENLFSDFECDKCNNDFSKYESDLANFLGAARAFNISAGKSANVKFKSPDKTFVVKKDVTAETGKPKVNIESHEVENDHFTMDTEKKTVTFHTIRHSYVPFNVYRIFLKIGLSILPEQYLEDYEIAINILRSKKKNPEINNPMFKMNMYVHPGPSFPSPMAILFEKKDKAARVPMHICCVMFHNYTYQLVLPFSKQDKWMYDGINDVTFPTMPPFIDKHFSDEFGLPRGHRLNFNLDELKKGEKHDMTFTFDSYTDTRDKEN